MSDKYTSESAIQLIRDKLSILLDSVNREYNSGKMVTEIDMVSLYQSAINDFVNSVDSSITGNLQDFKMGFPADPIEYNLFNDSIRKDLEILFLQVGSLDKIISSSFNSIIASKNKVIKTSKRISNKLGDYLLYADPSLGAGYFFGDSFSTNDKIENNSDLLEKEECFISNNEGAVFLPLDGAPQKIDIKSIIINKKSNGSFGNITDTYVFNKDNILAVTDGEPNTWVEYERISSIEANDPLVLDITLTLKEESIINHIHINPFNFGTATPVKIKTIETSLEGKEFKSIKEEFTIKDYIPSEQEDIFELSSSVNKNSGQGFYSFFPRRAKFIHLVFEQYTPYPINNNLRYAIGIRDINIYRRKFKTDGSIISIPFTANDEIRKVSMQAIDNPISKSILGGVSHYISNDDGGSWNELVSVSNSDLNIPEIINFNNISPNAIFSSTPVLSLRHKVSLNRNPDGFAEDAIIEQRKINKSELLPFSVNSNLITEQKFIEDSVSVLLPFYGSYGCPRENKGSNVIDKSYIFDLNKVDFFINNTGIDTLRFTLPFENIENLTEKIRVFINDEQIQLVKKDKAYLDLNSDTTYPTVDEDSKVYYLNDNGKELQFGYIDSSGDRRGFLPPAGTKVSIQLDGDNPSLELTDQGYVLNLSSPSDGIKENVKILSFSDVYEEEAEDFSIELEYKQNKEIVNKLKSKGLPTSISKPTIGKSRPVSASKFRTTSSRSIEKTTKTQSYKDIGYSNRSNVENINGLNGVEEYNSIAKELPPIFVDDISLYSIKEYDFDGSLLSSQSRVWTAKTFIDGNQELMDYNSSTGKWEKNEAYFSFNVKNGIVYTGGNIEKDRRTVFQCKKIKLKYLESDKWSFLEDKYTGKINSSKILLSPDRVYPIFKKITLSNNTDRKIPLIPNNTDNHNYYNQKLIKKTVKLSNNIFNASISPIEVKFIDGKQELSNVVYVNNETITFTEVSSNLYEYALNRITGDNTILELPGFTVKRSTDSLSAPTNIFQTYVSSTPSSNGQWTYSSGTVQVYWNSTLSDHYVNYKFENNNSGINPDALYSIDYDNGILYLGSSPITGSTISYQVSIYSAFYNISKELTDNEINKNIDQKTISFKEHFNNKLLKLDNVIKSIPQYVKISYKYYETKTESIKDLEPYFSPICRDVAFRAVTVNDIEGFE